MLLRSIDPRRSLVAGVTWLLIGLALSFAVAASLWAGNVAREIVVQQHVRRLVLETDQLASDIGQAISARTDAVKALQGSGSPAQVFATLVANYPQLGWIAAADATGRMVAHDGADQRNVDASVQPWFSTGSHALWLGQIETAGETVTGQVRLGDVSIPLRDTAGQSVGAIAARLNWHWVSKDIERLSSLLDSKGSAQTLLLNDQGRIVAGPAELLQTPWTGVALKEQPPLESRDSTRNNSAAQFEVLPSGETVLIARSALSLPADAQNTAWRVQLSEPKEHVYQRANALAMRIWWISLSLAAITALVGALGTRHLTTRLRRLTSSAAAVGRGELQRIEVPHGDDEVARVAAVFAKILDDLGQERSELLALSGDLERRVAIRTREVERLAAESRYAAVVRERLKIARDLHDTLAHSMMAMLSEVRLLRRLHSRNSDSLASELVRAEEVAQQGLNEARTAITQMRVNAVRDTGLGAALQKAFERFLDHTGLDGVFEADPQAARFGDERGESLFRMAEEALRNIEQHAQATTVSLTLRTLEHIFLELQIGDNGVGFSPQDAKPGHYGLLGLREQAQLIGAQIDIRSAPNAGTTIVVKLRMNPEML
jgi:signal transduction histidine kinase